MENSKEYEDQNRLSLLVELRDSLKRIIGYENFLFGGNHKFVPSYEKYLIEVVLMIEELKNEYKGLRE